MSLGSSRWNQPPSIKDVNTLWPFKVVFFFSFSFHSRVHLYAMSESCDLFWERILRRKGVTQRRPPVIPGGGTRRDSGWRRTQASVLSAAGPLWDGPVVPGSTVPRGAEPKIPRWRLQTSQFISWLIDWISASKHLTVSNWIRRFWEF